MSGNLKILTDNYNIRHTIAEKIGSGGEGDVFDLAEDKSLVAKIYKEQHSKTKLEKLEVMVNAYDERLKNVSAWPKAILKNEKGIPSGFLMPKVSEHKPIHELFNPAARKRYFPEVDYSFLIQSAKNIVAAFATIHSHGFIIGDVNEGNVLVSKHATIKLIDCDSFQVSKNGQLFPCEVGIPMYTPPELQNLKSFRDQDRTINHDLFGMAVICFQLLFMGRHPFVGVYNGPDTPLEKAIEKFWFAYGNSGQKRNIKPPADSLPFYTIPVNLQHLFEISFSETGVLKRPNVTEWLEELEFLKKHLRVCNRETKHKYFDGLTTCPWCELENGGVYFFTPSKIDSVKFSDFNLTDVWNKINDVSIISIEFPNPEKIAPKPKIKTKSFLWLKIAIVVQKLLAFLVPFFLISFASSYFIVWLIIGVIIFNISYFTNKLAEEKNYYRNAYNNAKMLWDSFEKRWNSEASSELFEKKKNELTTIKQRYEGLSVEYTKELRSLHQRMEELQLNKYLSNFLIHNHTIPNIGDNRKSTLASYGIDTAADISKLRRVKIPGFGTFLVGNLWGWRNNLAKKFKFDPSKGIDPEETNKLNAKFMNLKVQLQNNLRNGPEVLINLRNRIYQSRTRLHSESLSQAKDLVQAKADIDSFNFFN